MDKNISQNHGMSINERKSIYITGVLKVDSFDEEEFLLETTMGYLVIKGQNLEIVKLDTKDGIISIKGSFVSMSYIEELKKMNKENSILNKLLNIEENLDVFQLEKALFDVRWNLNKLIEEEKIKIKKESKTIITSLNEIEDEIEGLKDYYNSKAITYNEKYFKKPFYFLFKLFKLEDKKTFSLRKIENYEILKD